MVEKVFRNILKFIGGALEEGKYTDEVKALIIAQFEELERNEELPEVIRKIVGIFSDLEVTYDEVRMIIVEYILNQSEEGELPAPSATVAAQYGGSNLAAEEAVVEEEVFEADEE